DRASGSLAGPKRLRNSLRRLLPRVPKGRRRSSVSADVGKRGGRRGLLGRALSASHARTEDQEGRDCSGQSRQRPVEEPLVCGGVDFGKIVATVKPKGLRFVDSVVAGRGVAHSGRRRDLFQNVRRGRSQRLREIIHTADPAATLPQIVRIVLVL